MSEKSQRARHNNNNKHPQPVISDFHASRYAFSWSRLTTLLPIRERSSSLPQPAIVRKLAHSQHIRPYHFPFLTFLRIVDIKADLRSSNCNFREHVRHPAAHGTSGCSYDCPWSVCDRMVRLCVKHVTEEAKAKTILLARTLELTLGGMATSMALTLLLSKTARVGRLTKPLLLSALVCNLACMAINAAVSHQVPAQ